MNQCFWFRNDLRTKDNTALVTACKQAKEGVIALYIITPDTWKSHCWADCKVDFILRQLKSLSKTLQALNIPLKIIQTKSFDSTPGALLKFCKANQISAVYFNRSLLIDEMSRDKKVTRILNEHQINVQAFDEATILHPNLTLKSDETPFKVFTPFKRNWLKTAKPDQYFSDGSNIKKPKKLIVNSDDIPEKIDHFKRTPHIAEKWPTGEKFAHKKILDFFETHLSNYDKHRDFPGQQATSQLSAYLANGVISSRQCITYICDFFHSPDIHKAMTHNGATTWINELIWREFYYTVAFKFQEVQKYKPFKPKTNQLNWSKNKKNFEAWCAGKTGFPLVDAAMRQLNQTGWMHNRLRMVTAMFLTKTLYIHWRWGEDYFMRHLIDGDFASNNGGWQWSASTGTDAVPYFRIFNPTTQSTRFDPDGVFIKQFCPELKDCSSKEIHNPPSRIRAFLNYPEPIVDYSAMRAKVIAAFKALK